MKRWQKKVKKIAEELKWSFNLSDDGEYIYLQIYSPKGQDCFLEINAVSFDDFSEQVNNYYEGYDPEEEAMLWYGQKQGEPSSLRALLDDMDWFDNQLKLLSEAIEENI